MGPSTSVEFSLAGEQGLSVFAFPGNWATTMGRLRQYLGPFGSKQHSFGLCFNWDKVMRRKRREKGACVHTMLSLWGSVCVWSLAVAGSSSDRLKQSSLFS